MASGLIHVVGGGYNQIPLVKKAKELGLRVLVTDMYENPPCKALADFYEQIDTTDKEKTFAAAQKHKIDFIITDQTDVAVPTVAYIAENLNLPGIGYETSLKFTNKYLMRDSLKNTFQEAIPEFHFFNDSKEALEFTHSLPHPSEWLVKPINSQGSKGVARLEDQHFDGLIARAFHESKTRGILIEKYISGYEYSIEAYKQDNKVYNLALTKKYHYVSNDCIDERNTWLGDISPELEQQLFDINTKVIEALGLPFGITHAEYKVHKGRPYLMEIAARGGGGSISGKILPYLTGFMPIEGLIHQIIGDNQPVQFTDYKDKFAILKFFNLKPGIVKNVIVNPDMVAQLLEYTLDLKPGDSIRPVLDSRDRPGFFIVAGTDREKVIEMEEQVESAVQIEYA